ncbi:MAG: B12-binding domain-containing radical SAM protein [Candidatus Omnitrophica bacterium]|nr:B12-binding domain-containing radical SAM protein [Candidatus Omnitrophota bacterium]
MGKNKIVDVLFMSAPLQFKESENFVPSGDDTSSPPVGVMSIAAYLNSKGYNCKILDIGLKKMSLQEAVDFAKEMKPRMIGITILTPSTITAVPLANKIKKEIPEIVIGCGGMHVCVDPTFIERYPAFDFGVRGEGELIMLEILKKLDNGEKIAGLYEGDYVKDIDALPDPDYELIDFKEYGYPLDPIEKRETGFTIMSSRGCPFSCSFCCKTASRKYVRYRSPLKVVDEIQRNLSLSRGVYNFIDDTMTLNKKNCLEICAEIVKRKLKIQWLAMTRADSLDLELVKAMRKSGCREVFIGVESGDLRIRNQVIKKKVSDQAIKDAIKVCRKVGLRTSIFLMLGFPTEGIDEIQRTVNYPFTSKADIMGIHLTCPLPGSELYEQAIEEEIISGDIVDQFISGKLGKNYSAWPKYVPKGLTLDYMEKARAKAIRKFYLSPAFIFRLLQYYIRFPNRIKYDRHLYKSAWMILFKGRSKVQFS